MITRAQRPIARKKNEVTVSSSENPYLLSAVWQNFVIFSSFPKKTKTKQQTNKKPL